MGPFGIPRDCWPGSPWASREGLSFCNGQHREDLIVVREVYSFIGEPEGRQDRPGKGQRARSTPGNCFKVPMVLLAFLLVPDLIPVHSSHLLMSASAFKGLGLGLFLKGSLPFLGFLAFLVFFVPWQRKPRNPEKPRKPREPRRSRLKRP